MRERRIYDDPSTAATSHLLEGFYHFLSHFTCGNSQRLDVLRPPIQLKRYHHLSDRWFIARPPVFRWAFDQAGSISRTFPVRVPRYQMIRCQQSQDLQGANKTLPVVLRPSSCLWASAASLKGNVP